MGRNNRQKPTMPAKKTVEKPHFGNLTLFGLNDR